MDKIICYCCKEYLSVNKFYNNKAQKWHSFKSCFCKVCDNKRNKKRAIKEQTNSVIHYLKSLFYSLKTGAKKRKLYFEININDLINLYNIQKGMCYITQQEMTHIRGKGRIPTNISVDRIDCNKGYTIDNIRLICIAVNKMRQEFTDEELKRWCQLILANQLAPPIVR